MCSSNKIEKAKLQLLYNFSIHLEKEIEWTKCSKPLSGEKYEQLLYAKAKWQVSQKYFYDQLYKLYVLNSKTPYSNKKK